MSKGQRSCLWATKASAGKRTSQRNFDEVDTTEAQLVLHIRTTNSIHACRECHLADSLLAHEIADLDHVAVHCHVDRKVRVDEFHFVHEALGDARHLMMAGVVVGR